MRRINQEHIIGVVCIGIAAVTFGLASRFPTGQAVISVSGPALFPKALAILLLLCGVGEIFVGFRRKTGNMEVSVTAVMMQLKRPEVQNVYIIIGLVIAYIALFEPVGFYLTTFGFVFVMMLRLGVPAGRNILYSAIFVGIIYLIFGRLFTISLPSGLLSFAGL